MTPAENNTIAEDIKRNYPQHTVVPPCHVEGVYVFTLGKARIHAGGRNAVDTRKWGLIVNLLGSNNYQDDISFSGGAQRLCPRFANVTHTTTVLPPEVVIEWRDRGVPEVKRKVWRKLIEDLSDLEGDVLVHCFGGHGRTGTLLTILASLGNVVPAHTDPVEWIRTTYCKKTVESVEQVKYLKTNMQIKTDAEPTYKPITITHNFNESDWFKAYRERNPISTPLSLPLTNLPTDPDPLLYRCSQCFVSQAGIRMYSKFRDGSGVCTECHWNNYQNRLGHIYDF